MATKTYRIYGREGHRVKESFGSSYIHDWTEGDDVRIISVACADLTGTNDYVDLTITRNTVEECQDELQGQESDGIFENQRIGKMFEIQADGSEREIYTFPFKYADER